jgi:glycosyltransferase involved in cell wall biosynthesis
MKIGIDARCLEWNIGGPARYLINMLKLWPQLSRKHKYVLFFQNHIPEADFLNNELFEKVLIAGPKLFKSRRIVGEQLLMPFAIKKHKIELYFTPWYSIPLVPLGVKTVIGAWDIACSTHPHHYTILDRISFGIFVPRSYKKADGLLTCSNFDAQQIISYCNIPPERFCVVPYATDDKFAPTDDSEHIKAFRKKYGFPERYILSMGIIIPRRNVDVVVDAFNDICNKYSDMGLVVVGRNVTVPFVDIKNKMKPLIDKGRGFYFSRVSEEDIVDFYRGAWYYVCTSTVDGESLMLKEAMKCGTPVITSPLLMETVGWNALMLEDPTDRKQTAEVLQRAITDSKLREHYSVEGKKWVDALSWKKVAEKSLRFIESR